MSSEQEQTEGSSRSTDTTQPVHGGGNSASVDQVFSMFKDYLEKKLEVKTKQIEQNSQSRAIEIQGQPEAVRAQCRIGFHH